MGSPNSAGVCVRLEAESLLPFQLLEQWQAQAAAGPMEAPAATSLFIGRVRGTTLAGVPLEALELEHYPGMTERQLAQLARGCAERHAVREVLVVHRVGRIQPGEAIVLVAVHADRRGPAQRCCQELLEALKHEAPFWKREWSGGVGTWVAGNTPLEG
jgi:molybdopterin synthase catalytic subunit